ncbi:gamma-glutamyltranspeptidase / glutathione hydrolase [Nitrosomonas eutropha]|uniref:gamma-glutamyltransferase n=1 Tax=Nitrosomonas eutropha TaxID=916 RepID=UPI00088C4A36|nr:gamma-glutamyltransferase [Nitrosomonas eutropha]SCX25068.1 gamma-glutamyltranspeptidase / glutathione hydrolase [Nitrosomonas eutropha]
MLIRNLFLLLSNIPLVLLTACSTTPTVPLTTSPSVSQITAAAIIYDWDMDIFHPVVARHGMVATEQKLASRIGVDILKAGGNAIDAAVAIGFGLAVTLPNAGNIGGGGFMLVHDAQTRRSTALDFRETAPAAASRDMYLDSAGNVINKKSLFSHAAVGVPGTVAGMIHALQRWGSMPLAKVMQPAITLAEEGYPVSKTLAKGLQYSAGNMGKWPATRAIFWKNDMPLKAGDKLVQQDLANSLRLIARDGARAFYAGEIAHRIAADMARNGSPMTLEDLKNYRITEREPVRGTYRGYEIITMPPPSSGGVHLLQILNMLEHWPLWEWGHNSARTIHHMTEAMKLAYADRSEYLGDPDFVNIPLTGLTSKAYAEALVSHIDPDHARVAEAIKPGQPQFHESNQTTHFSVMDSAGNMVAVTYTLNTNFGSGIVAPGTGIVLNNEMDDFSIKLGVPNVYGVIGGEANAVAAGKRPLSSMTPAFVFKAGKPWLVTGSPGGPRIITTVLQQIVNSIDFAMNPAEAASAARFHHQWIPDELRLEKGISPDTLRLLQKKGHRIVIKPTMGRTQTIQLHGDELWGYSDPRNPDGATVGF